MAADGAILIIIQSNGYISEEAAIVDSVRFSNVIEEHDFRYRFHWKARHGGGESNDGEDCIAVTNQHKRNLNIAQQQQCKSMRKEAKAHDIRFTTKDYIDLAMNPGSNDAAHSSGDITMLLLRDEEVEEQLEDESYLAPEDRSKPKKYGYSEKQLVHLNKQLTCVTYICIELHNRYTTELTFIEYMF